MVDAFIAIVVIVGLWLYSRWLKRGIAPCTFETVLPRDRIRAIFRGSVTGVAWNIVQDDDSDDDSMVARGGLSDWLTVIPLIGYLIGGKQEIALHMSEEDEESNKLQVVVGAHLFIRRILPVKAHTLRVRINRFLRNVRTEDPGIVVVRHPQLLKDTEFEGLV